MLLLNTSDATKRIYLSEKVGPVSGLQNRGKLLFMPLDSLFYQCL